MDWGKRRNGWPPHHTAGCVTVLWNTYWSVTQNRLIAARKHSCGMRVARACGSRSRRRSRSRQMNQSSLKSCGRCSTAVDGKAQTGLSVRVVTMTLKWTGGYRRHTISHARSELKSVGTASRVRSQSYGTAQRIDCSRSTWSSPQAALQVVGLVGYKQSLKDMLCDCQYFRTPSAMRFRANKEPSNKAGSQQPTLQIHDTN